MVIMLNFAATYLLASHITFFFASPPIIQPQGACAKIEKQTGIRSSIRKYNTSLNPVQINTESTVFSCHLLFKGICLFLLN